jgi:small subunit ribosomal protein S17
MAKRATRKVRVGTVVSDAMDKTIVVAVESKARHPLYGKTIKRTRKLYAHDEENQCQTGDLVKVVETRPLSRTKRWRMVSIIEKVK